jgi:2-oxoisovalerate dehydrogenase E1 component beta subunit
MRASGAAGAAGAARCGSGRVGFASELSALVQERCFYHLEAPVGRVTGWDTPYPHAYEWAYFPGPRRMKKALEKVMAD